MTKEIHSGVIYTVAPDCLFIPCRAGYWRAISPGHKFLKAEPEHRWVWDRKGQCEFFHMVDELANHVFLIEKKYLDKIVEVEDSDPND